MVVVVWRKGGEEERGRGGGGLCLEETLRSPVPRPFRNPSGAPLAPFQGLSSVLSRTFASAVLWQGSALRTGTTHNVSIVSFKRVLLTVIMFMCGFSLCPLNPEESHTQNKSKKVKRVVAPHSIPSAHITPP